MTLAQREASRTLGEPVNLYLFKGADPTLESLLRAVSIGPGVTEFGYGTTQVTRSNTPLNHVAGLSVSDFVASMGELEAVCPDLKQVTLVVGWHGTDLRCGVCDIKPKVETSTGGETPYTWQVGGLTRGSASVVSQISSKPAFGGAPSDRSVYEAIVHLKARGWKVTVYPTILMDIAAGNSLTNPYGGSSQPVYPWRGKITCHPAPGEVSTVDQTATAATQVDAFFGSAEAADFGWNGTSKVVTYSGPAEWKFNRFILHLATIADAAGADDFLIGSELVGLTTVRSDATTFPAVAKLIDLAAECRTLLGSGVRISYAADWTEYHSYRPDDGSDDVLFHLDPLWSDSEIDFIGIDDFSPLTDWRDGATHTDLEAGFATIYDRRYLRSGIEGGEYFDWYYASSGDRDDQVRTDIIDIDHDEDWVFANKNLRGWWSNEHFDRPLGVRSLSSTDWVPESKPVVKTARGFPAVDKSTNEPTAFLNNASPHYSSGVSDTALMRAALETDLQYWRPDAMNNPESGEFDGHMIEWDTIAAWTWDARPQPTWPQRSDIWSDAAKYAAGPYISGRVESGKSFDGGIIGPFAYTDCEQPVVRDGITFAPVPITRGNVTASGTLDKSTLEVRCPRSLAVADLYKAYPPSSVINLIIIKGHTNLDPDQHYVVEWAGRVLGAQRAGSEITFSCEPVSTSMRRSILKRNYQLGCPFVLYGIDCRASKAAATKSVTVDSVSGNQVGLPSGWPQDGFVAAKYLGGIVEWTKEDGTIEVRTIRRVTGGTTLVLAGDTRGLSAGDTVKVVRYCDHKMTGCNEHGNIHNFGGQPWIPTKNPLRNVSVYY